MLCLDEPISSFDCIFLNLLNLKPAHSQTSKLIPPTFLSEDFPWSKEVQDKLGAMFKLSKFRPLQLQAINLSMSGKDLFLVMPTGRGKSLCYQLPAVCSKGDQQC